jgi:hypothetical protein
MYTIEKLGSGCEMIVLEDETCIIVTGVVAIVDGAVELPPSAGEVVEIAKASPTLVAKEVPKEVPKAAPVAGPGPDDDGGELEPYTREEIMAMDKDTLEDLIEEEDLDIDPDDYPKTKALRQAVLEALELDEDDD